MGKAVDELTTRFERTRPWFHGLRIVRGDGSREPIDRLPTAWAHPERTASRSALLECYIRGWAEANPLKIMRVADPCYLFNDPLIGLFSRTSLPRYFQLLRTKFAVAGVTRQREVGFCLSGFADGGLTEWVCRFQREAPGLGLTGIANVVVCDRGVLAEQVVYDTNLALDVLGRPFPQTDAGTLPACPAASPSTPQHQR